MASPPPSPARRLAARCLSRKPLTRCLWLVALAAALGSLAAGCSPLYVMRAAYEEGKILWRREPIAAYLDRPDVDADTKEKLALVLEVREYARESLRLNVGGSYSSYSYVDRPDLTYILSAAPKTELVPYTWWFLVIGRVPYKGYFSKPDADQAAAKLRARGYDTNIRTSAAFSTLGWFDDPLLAHLLRFDKVTLAEVIFHELFHNTLYVKGAGSFNESVANFVGGRAAIDFFRARFGAQSGEYRRAIRNWQDELEFSKFIEKLAGALNELYERDIPYEDKLRLREAVFARYQKEWADRLPDRFRSFAHQSLNNAIVIQYLLYLKDLELFDSLYRRQGEDLAQTIEAIRQAVAEGSEPFEQVRALFNARAAS